MNLKVLKENEDFIQSEVKKRDIKITFLLFKITL